MRDQVRLECSARGNAATISESRPIWAQVSDEWVSNRVAQLRLDPTTQEWTLWWADRNGRWMPVEYITPGSLSDALAELTADRHALFWG